MGQRSPLTPGLTAEVLNVSVFATPLGYWAIAGRDNVLFRLTLGHASAAAAHRAIADSFEQSAVQTEPEDWNSRLRQRLERYAAGERVEFDDVKLLLPKLTSFQQRIVEVTRALKHGETVTYGELATRAGYPRAARAVGTVMSSNRIPIIIPCHRVLGAGGSIGGYSAPQGVSLKSRLLELERG
jgi:methylated-DNA-[protein]-cysteine S-methyltransferase